MIHSVMIAGLDMTDYAIFLLRALLGCFFVLARFRWICDPSRPNEMWFNKSRHEHLEWKLCTCGYSRHPMLSAMVALIEVFAGCALIFGLLTMPALVGLFVVLCFATCCTAKQKVMEQSPVDCVDCVSCYLWRVEGVYLTICACLLLTGPGKFSLDYFLF